MAQTLLIKNDEKDDFVKFNVQFSGHSFTMSCNYMRPKSKGC